MKKLEWWCPFIGGGYYFAGRQFIVLGGNHHEPGTADKLKIYYVYINAYYFFQYGAKYHLVWFAGIGFFGVTGKIIAQKDKYIDSPYRV